MFFKKFQKSSKNDPTQNAKKIEYFCLDGVSNPRPPSPTKLKNAENIGNFLFTIMGSPLSKFLYT